MANRDLESLKKHLKALPKLTDSGQERRVKRAKSDFFYFIKTYFPHHINNVKKESSYFRNYIHKNIDALTKEHKEIVISAYRGAAKSTTLTNFYTLWEIARKNRHFIVLISSTKELAISLFELIALEIEENINFKSDFNIKINSLLGSSLEIKVDEHPLKLETFGSGAKIRGIRYIAYRPDLIILDDVENDENVASRAQRDKLESWYKKAIKKLPDRIKPYNIITVGTILHHDSLLSRLKVKAPYYKNFPLVLDFKTWEIDDSRISAKEVQKEYEDDKDSFLSEFQNQPLSSESLPFYGYEEVDDIPLHLPCYMGVDPALGKARGDYFGISLIHKDKECFYGSSYGYKVTPEIMIDKIIDYYLIYKPLKIGIETVAFQEFFKDTLLKRAKKRDIHLPVIEIKSRVAKEIRIDSLTPYIKNRTLKIYKNCHLLIDELLTYPKCAHDDLLDSLEMAFKLALGGNFDYKSVNSYLQNRKKEDIFINKMLKKDIGGKF